MSISLFNAVPAGAIEVLSGMAGAPQFKRADIGRFLGIVVIARNNNKIATKSRSELSESAYVGNVPRSGMYGGGENPHDAFVDLEGALDIVVRSRKPRAVELVKWLTRKGIEKIAEDRLAAQREQHQKAIAEKQRSIDEKDMQIALLDDDLTVAQQDNLELKAEIERLTPQAVPHLEDPRKDNGIVVIQKNNGDLYPYLAISGQQSYVAQKI